MKKIISLFQRNYDGDRLVRDEIVQGAEWVPAGEGIATRKFDGTCCLIRNSTLFQRYDAKQGKPPPPQFEPAQDADPVTGHWPGWVPVTSLWHLKAWERLGPLPDGTYELCGPHFQANPERFELDTFVPHGAFHLDCPRTFTEIKDFLATADIEGIVWHHPDGRMVKIKTKDFGLTRTRP